MTDHPSAGPPGLNRPKLANLTIQSLVGLALGVAAGLVLANQRLSPGPALDGAEGLVRAWTNGFRLIVGPLVFSQLFLAVANRATPAGTLRRLGWVTPAVFAGLLAATAGLSVGLMVWLMGLPILQGVSLPAPDPVAGGAAAAGGAEWVDQFIPPNLFAAAGGDNILPLMLFAVAFGLGTRRLTPALQESLERAFTALGGVLFLMVEWLFRLAPAVMVALGLTSAYQSGLRVGGVMLAFTGVESVVLIAAVLLLYPIAWVIGRQPLGPFARALLPGQLLAATSRSSLATVPLLLAGAERLGLPKAGASYTVPLGGAMLKLSRAVSGPVKLLFLASVLGIPLDLERVLVFTATIMLLSPSTVGVPRVTSGTRSLPAYVAAGVPPEYVVLLGATTAVTDIFMTVLNSSGYLTAAAVTARFTVRPAPQRQAATEPSVAAAAGAQDA